MSKKKIFDFVIGNPPYQEATENTSDKPVYNIFMDAAYQVANKVELITPGRFLFGAGKTPKEWNEKMMNDSHLKVLEYEPDGAKIFPNTGFKGGVAITYRDATKECGAIEFFTKFVELRTIKEKVFEQTPLSLNTIMYSSESYKFTPKLHIDFPNLKYVDENHGVFSKSHDYDIATSVFEKLENTVFFKKKPSDGYEYIRIIGRNNGERAIYYIKKVYIEDHPNLNKWKVFLPKSNGSGAIGENLSTPLVGEPLVGGSQTFLSIGSFDNKDEAQNCMKYIKSKFCRVMLGILKITQHNPPNTWKYVPLQNFTSSSDIDWSKSIHDIDLQLYKKYGLDQHEIDFIETNVKEMN